MVTPARFSATSVLGSLSPPLPHCGLAPSQPEGFHDSSFRAVEVGGRGVESTRSIIHKRSHVFDLCLSLGPSMPPPPPPSPLVPWTVQRGTLGPASAVFLLQLWVPAIDGSFLIKTPFPVVCWTFVRAAPQRRGWRGDDGTDRHAGCGPDSSARTDILSCTFTRCNTHIHAHARTSWICKAGFGC